MESTDRPKLRPLEAIPQEVEGETAILLRDPEGITDKVAALPPGLAQFLFANLTGEHTLAELEEREKNDVAISNRQAPRLLLTGSPPIFPNLKVPILVEQAGGIIVADEVCSSNRLLYDTVA